LRHSLRPAVPRPSWYRDGETADGTPIVLFQCHGSPNQRWFIGRGQISENYGSCLDVQGSEAVDDAAIILVTCNGRPSQQWRVIDGQIIGLGNKCLDSKDGNASVFSLVRSLIPLLTF
jgi:hypothetical protein